MPSGDREVDSRIRTPGRSELAEVANSLPERLERIAHRIALELQANIDQLALSWYEAMLPIAELAPWSAPELRELALQNARVDIGREVEGLVDGRRLPLSCPQEVADSARLGVEANFPLWGALQSYRTGHAVQWESWSEAVEETGLVDADRRALLRAGSDYMFAYADRCSRWIEIEYTRARDRRLRSDEQRRVQLVRDLLDGAEVDATALEHDLSAWHLGVVCLGSGSESLLHSLAQRMRAELLDVAADQSTRWGWFSWREKPAPAIDRALREVKLPTDAAVFFGTADAELDGFRRTHFEAQDARAIGERLGLPTARYEEIALEDLAMQDPQMAARFVQRELGPLAGSDRRAAVLRETLKAYFIASQRASSAAELLQVHERTIGNRLRAIERLTGSQLQHRHAELLLATRLHPLADTD